MNLRKLPAGGGASAASGGEEQNHRQEDAVGAAGLAGTEQAQRRTQRGARPSRHQGTQNQRPPAEGRLLRGPCPYFDEAAHKKF